MWFGGSSKQLTPGTTAYISFYVGLDRVHGTKDCFGFIIRSTNAPQILDS